MISKETQQKDIICFLNQLNQDIEIFIKGSIESSVNIEKWSGLSDMLKPLRCWDIKGCMKVECPAYGSDDHRCWLRVGTMCGGKVQGEFAQKYRTCFECDVHKRIAEEPVRALYERISTLIFHLNDKAVKLNELAIKDPLTGLYNRHFFNEIVKRDVASANRKDETLSFIIIDLDNFKRINDTLGHLTGDRILIEAAGLFANTIRKADLAIRYGGDEFLIFVRDGDCDKTANLIMRLQDVVEKWNNDNAEVFGCRLSFSAGCSVCGNNCDINAALMEADERMYINKRGKNCNNIKRDTK